MTDKPTRRVIALIDTDNDRWDSVGDDLYALHTRAKGAQAGRSVRWIDEKYGVIGAIIEEET